MKDKVCPGRFDTSLDVFCEVDIWKTRATRVFPVKTPNLVPKKMVSGIVDSSRIVLAGQNLLSRVV